MSDSKLNPNASEFKFSLGAKEFVPPNPNRSNAPPTLTQPPMETPQQLPYPPHHFHPSQYMISQGNFYAPQQFYAAPMSFEHQHYQNQGKGSRSNSYGSYPPPSMPQPSVPVSSVTPLPTSSPLTIKEFVPRDFVPKEFVPKTFVPPSTPPTSSLSDVSVPPTSTTPLPSLPSLSISPPSNPAEKEEELNQEEQITEPESLTLATASLSLSSSEDAVPTTTTPATTTPTTSENNKSSTSFGISSSSTEKSSHPTSPRNLLPNKALSPRSSQQQTKGSKQFVDTSSSASPISPKHGAPMSNRGGGGGFGSVSIDDLLSLRAGPPDMRRYSSHTLLSILAEEILPTFKLVDRSPTECLNLPLIDAFKNVPRSPRNGFRFPKTPLPDAPLKPVKMVTPSSMSKIQQDPNDPEVIVRKLKAILNKLSLTNFNKLFEEMLTLGINKFEIQTRVVDNIVSKAQMEEGFSEMYATLCSQLIQRWKDTPLSEEEQEIWRVEQGQSQSEEESSSTTTTTVPPSTPTTTSESTTIAPESSSSEGANKKKKEDQTLGDVFKRKLLGKCASEFDVNRSEEIQKIRTNPTLAPDEKEEKEFAIKRKFTGHMRFIGELYMKELITKKTMHRCLNDLLFPSSSSSTSSSSSSSSSVLTFADKELTMEEEPLMCLCKLMQTVGSKLEAADQPKKKKSTLSISTAPFRSPKMDEYFQALHVLSEHHPLSRVRFQIKDMMESRENGWTLRREEEKAKDLSQPATPVPSVSTSSSSSSTVSTPSASRPHSQDARNLSSASSPSIPTSPPTTPSTPPTVDEWKTVVPRANKQQQQPPTPSSSRNPPSTPKGSGGAPTPKSSTSTTAQGGNKSGGGGSGVSFSKSSPSPSNNSNRFQEKDSNKKKDGKFGKSPSSNTPSSSKFFPSQSSSTSSTSSSTSTPVSSDSSSPTEPSTPTTPSTTAPSSSDSLFFSLPTDQPPLNEEQFSSVMKEIKLALTGDASEIPDVMNNLKSLIHPSQFAPVICELLIMLAGIKAQEIQRLSMIFDSLNQEGFLRGGELVDGLVSFFHKIDDLKSDAPKLDDYVADFLGPYVFSFPLLSAFTRIPAGSEFELSFLKLSLYLKFLSSASQSLQENEEEEKQEKIKQLVIESGVNWRDESFTEGQDPLPILEKLSLGYLA